VGAGDGGALPVGAGEGVAVPVAAVGAHTGSPGIVATAGLVAEAGLVAGPGLIVGPGPAGAGLLAAGLGGAVLAAGEAASYRYRLYCRIRPMSFVP
jgi:hypothetical protein